jgi:hypothetical protein
MKTNKLQKMAAVLTVAGLAWTASSVLAQDSSATSPAPAAAVSVPVPQLAYGEQQILQLAQSKVGDATIIAYIKNSGNSYGLNADQIIYLRQQGISDAVIVTMLNQPRAGVAAAAPPTSAAPPATSAYSSEPASTATAAAPAVTYVQTIPATTYYYQPYYYQPYYYPSYAWYPPVTFSFGWGGWRGGGGWHGGGFGGGWHGGGGHR